MQTEELLFFDPMPQALPLYQAKEVGKHGKMSPGLGTAYILWALVTYRCFVL